MKQIDVIGMPMKYGCPVDGADLAFDYTKDLYEKEFKNCNIDVVDVVAIDDKPDKKIKNIKTVMNTSERLYTKVLNSLNKGDFPIIVGGDHSSAIGSISASLDYTLGDLTVIWIDAHADIHNEKTTPSGNIHGMPLSVCIGRCDDRFKIGNYKLNPNNLYYIGLRNYELEEINYINEAHATCYMDFEVIERKIENVVKEILKNIKTKYVHISFDLDALSKDEFPAVNVCVDNKYVDGLGLDIITAKKCLNMLLTNLNVCSMDIVEYNPLLDKDYSCKNKIDEILKVIDASLK